MPCRSDYQEPTPVENREVQRVADDLKLLADDLTHSLDVLREYALNRTSFTIVSLLRFDPVGRINSINASIEHLYAPAVNRSNVAELHGIVQGLILDYLNLVDDIANGIVDIETIRVAQVAHRKKDLERLLATFGASGDKNRLRKVLDADPDQPLEPQLGFDPDDF